MTTLLLSEIENNEINFNSQPHKIIWKRICTTINEFGYNVTPDQCCSKWRSLKRKYKQIKDNNNHTGAANQRWVHFNNIDNILKKKPEINPVSLASNIGGFRIRNVVPNVVPNVIPPVVDSDDESLINELIGPDDGNEMQENASAMFPMNGGGVDRFTRTPVHRRRSRSEPYWAQALREQRERHHKENMSQKERFLSVVEELLK